MMRKIREEKGMTLVELIAALALAGMLVVIIMTTFSIGTRYQSLETNNLAMQQEMNLLITTVTQIHRSGECYSLNNVENGLEITTYTRMTAEDGSDLRGGRCTTTPKSYNSPAYDNNYYGIEICRLRLQGTESICEQLNATTVIDPQRENLRARITLDDESGKKLIQETTFSRFKEESIDEEDSTETTP